jgi:hypothetical protein
MDHCITQTLIILMDEEKWWFLMEPWSVRVTLSLYIYLHDM